MEKLAKELVKKGYTVKKGTSDNGLESYTVSKGGDTYGEVEVTGKDGRLNVYNQYGSFEGDIVNPTLKELESGLKSIYEEYK